MKPENESRIQSALDEGNAVESEIFALMLGRNDAREARELADVDAALHALGRATSTPGDPEAVLAGVLKCSEQGAYDGNDEFALPPCTRQPGEPDGYWSEARATSLFGLGPSKSGVPHWPVIALAAAAVLGFAGLGASFFEESRGELGAAHVGFESVGDASVPTWFADFGDLERSYKLTDTATGVPFWVLSFGSEHSAENGIHHLNSQDPEGQNGREGSRVVYVPKSHSQAGVLERALGGLRLPATGN